MTTPKIMRMDWKALGYQATYKLENNNYTLTWNNMTPISEAKSAAGDNS
jgi:hypothetical protein